MTLVWTPVLPAVCEVIARLGSLPQPSAAYPFVWVAHTVPRSGCQATSTCWQVLSLVLRSAAQVSLSGWRGWRRVRVLLGAAAGLVTDERRACSARLHIKASEERCTSKAAAPRLIANSHQKATRDSQQGGRQAGRHQCKQAGKLAG